MKNLFSNRFAPDSPQFLCHEKGNENVESSPDAGIRALQKMLNQQNKNLLNLDIEIGTGKAGGLTAANKGSLKILYERSISKTKKTTANRGKMRLTKSQRALLNKAEKVRGVGLNEARNLSVENQFDLAKTSLDQRQRHLEKLYLGHNGDKAFFEVFEKHLGRTFDTRTGAIGAVGWILGRVGLSYNRSLEKKMEKQCGIKPENFRKLYGEMQQALSENQMQFEQMEASEAADMNMSVDSFRKSGEYKTFVKDIAIVGLSIGMSALGLSTGISIPLMHVSPKRRAFAMDANAALKYMGEGVSYTDAVTQVSQETDRSVFMANNLLRSGSILHAGPDGKQLAHLDKRWDNFAKMSNDLSFDLNSYNHGDIASKSLYESLGFVIDSQGLIHCKESKKLKNVLYQFGERLFTDRTENRAFLQAIKTLKKMPNKRAKDHYSESEIVQLNQEKIEALETIMASIKRENAEDFLRRGARRSPGKMNEFMAEQHVPGVFDQRDFRRKYRKKPERMEGRIASLRQMERFLESQRVLVKNQRNFYAMRSLGKKQPETAVEKANVLYQGAILGFLSSYTSAKAIVKDFPIVPGVVKTKEGRYVIAETEKGKQGKITQLLHEYFTAKDTKSLRENRIVAKMTKEPAFVSWMKDIGQWSELQKADPCCYQTMSCLEKIEYDLKRIKCKTPKKGYEFNSVATVTPRGQGKGIPLIISSAWLFPKAIKIPTITKKNIKIGQIETGDHWAYPKKASKFNSETGKGSWGLASEMTISDPDAYILIPTTRTGTIITEENIVSLDNPIARKLVANYGPTAAGLFAAGVLPAGNTKSQKRIKRDEKNRYRN